MGPSIAMPQETLVEIWREVGRHLEVGDSLGRLAPLIARKLPLAQVALWRIEPDTGRAWVLALADHEGAPLDAPSRQQLTARAQGRLAHWGRGALVEERNDPLYEALWVGRAPWRGCVGPLHDGEGRLDGALSLAWEGAPVGAAQFARDLLEPLGVALHNERRVQEMTELRERVEADNRALLQKLQRDDITDAVVGAEHGLREVMGRVEQVASTEAPVLILGETGSGKEVIARAIHQKSRRAKGPMLRINCGAIPAELIDSELFGHERGSFTGAVSERRGWFERASGGTLFLDEIGELPLAAQVRLLRVLQDGTLTRVGGQRPLTVDVRIVAATHRDLVSMVAEGGFREDLWYRLGVFPIRLPPLRERRQDIPILAEHFAARAGVRLGGAPLRLKAQDHALLQSYRWPGNVRELVAVLERAAILGNGKRLELEAALGMGQGVTPERDAPSLAAPSLATPTLPPAPLPGQASVGASGKFPTLDEAMATHISAALARTHGKIEGAFGAARLLGINPHTLRSRMRKLGLEWGKFRNPNASL